MNLDNSCRIVQNNFLYDSFGKKYGQVSIAIAEHSRHFTGSAFAFCPAEMNAFLFEQFIFDGIPPWKIKMFVNAANGVCSQLIFFDKDTVDDIICLEKPRPLGSRIVIPSLFWQHPIDCRSRKPQHAPYHQNDPNQQQAFLLRVLWLPYHLHWILH